MTGSLEGFAVTAEELSAATEELRLHRGGIRDGRICLCGHPVTRHSEWEGKATCAPTRMNCPCALVMPVIDVVDTRPFLRKTQGEGVDHALMQGLSGLIEKNREWKWMTGFPVCMRCEVEDVPVMPFAIGAGSRPSREPEQINVLLCVDCAKVVGRDGMS